MSDDVLIDVAFSCLEQSKKSSVVIVPVQTIAHHEWGWRKSGLGEIRFILVQIDQRPSMPDNMILQTSKHEICTPGNYWNLTEESANASR